MSFCSYSCITDCTASLTSTSFTSVSFRTFMITSSLCFELTRPSQPTTSDDPRRRNDSTRNVSLLVSHPPRIITDLGNVPTIRSFTNFDPTTKYVSFNNASRPPSCSTSFGRYGTAFPTCSVY